MKCVLGVFLWTANFRGLKNDSGAFPFFGVWCGDNLFNTNVIIWLLKIRQRDSSAEQEVFVANQIMTKGQIKADLEGLGQGKPCFFSSRSSTAAGT